MSDILAGAALLVVSAAAAASILLPRGPAPIGGDVVRDRLLSGPDPRRPVELGQISDLRDDPARLVALAVAAVAAAVILAAAFRRWAAALPLAIVFALPFRIPLHAGGDTANLLVPLYLVIGGGVLFVASRDRGS